MQTGFHTKLFSVILNTASLILETLRLRIEPGFIDFLFDLQAPTTFDDYCPLFSPLVGNRRSQEKLTPAPGDQPFCQESALLHFETLEHSVTLFATV